MIINIIILILLIFKINLKNNIIFKITDNSKIKKKYRLNKNNVKLSN